MTVLVDTGAAACFGPTLGRIGDNLRAAGYAPEQVDAVLLTHLHGDHACGLAANGQMAFPNATVHVDKADADYSQYYYYRRRPRYYARPRYYYRPRPRYYYRPRYYARPRYYRRRYW